MRPTVIDLTHTIYHDMPTYPGLPRPIIGLHLDHASSRQGYDHRAEFAIGSLDLVGNTGTYLDSPFHRYPDAPDISALPLDRLVDLPTTVIDAHEEAEVERGLDLVLALAGPLAGRAVLIHTRWDRRWGTDGYWDPGPYLGPTTLQQLVHHRPALVGVDFWNVDDPADPRRPAHSALLALGIPIVEHLRNLDHIPAGATTSFVPLPVRGAPSLPIRAYATAHVHEPPAGR